MTKRALDQLEWIVRSAEPLEEIPLLTSDRAFPIETILAPAGVDEFALIAAIERSAADWLPLESEVTQLARANIGGSGGMAGGGFGGGGFSAGGFGGGTLSDGDFGSVASDGAFVGEGGDSGDFASLSAIRGRDSEAAAGARADDAIAARSTGFSDANTSLRTSGSRGHGGDGDDRGKGNRGSSGGGSHPSRGSGGPPETTSVPEPSSLLLMGIGLVSLARLRRRAAR